MDLNALENQTGIRKAVLEEIILLAQKYEIEEVLLYGSRSRGDHERTSDIDLAISGGKVIDFSLDVDEEASTLLFFDIIDLDHTSHSKFKEEVLQDGIKLYEKDRKL